jgi:hypothetical protein
LFLCQKLKLLILTYSTHCSCYRWIVPNLEIDDQQAVQEIMTRGNVKIQYHEYDWRINKMEFGEKNN